MSEFDWPKELDPDRVCAAVDLIDEWDRPGPRRPTTELVVELYRVLAAAAYQRGREDAAKVAEEYEVNGTATCIAAAIRRAP